MKKPFITIGLCSLILMMGACSFEKPQSGAGEVVEVQEEAVAVETDGAAPSAPAAAPSEAANAAPAAADAPAQ